MRSAFIDNKNHITHAALFQTRSLLKLAVLSIMPIKKYRQVLLFVKPVILATAVISSALTAGCSEQAVNSNVGLAAFTNKTVLPNSPLSSEVNITGSLVKKLTIELTNPANYASLSLYGDNVLLADNLNIAKSGKQSINVLVRFPSNGKVKLTFRSNNADVMINHLLLEDMGPINVPNFSDISIKAGIDKVNSIKYGGPTIADIDQDGDYDFIVNNHNQESSKLYWNNGDGTVSKHNKDLARWFMHDLHGTSVGDFDNDGDLDLVVTQGGGNGKNPSKANFYTNNNGTFVLTTGDVAIDKGGRGRGAKWSDMDLDGDLDLMLINETSLAGSKPQHFFYENLGDGTFTYKPIAGLQDQHPSRALITDINNDHIDDVILYGPLSVWQGNGDFTFTDITSQFPADISSIKGVMGIADLDIDNDGDLDLYLARGKEFEGGFGEKPSLDHDPITKELSIKPRGYKGVDSFEFTADGDIKFHSYYYLSQGIFRGKDYPIFLGANKNATVLASGDEFVIEQQSSIGWPTDLTENGMYFGFVGDSDVGSGTGSNPNKGKWKAALVRNGDIFWGFNFSLSGINSVTPNFEPENRNTQDILLRNDNGTFTNVTESWNLPSGGNALGVTVGDFNNDSFQDVFVYRWGKIDGRISDYMLLNDGKNQFQTVTMHGANDVGGPGNGDMGQAFDFDLDGDLDLLNGSEGGQWYLYQNGVSDQTESLADNAYVLVNVGYSPQSHVDAISAEVIVKTAKGEFTKRVGSAGSVFSQSLLNIVHFGLGDVDVIESIKVRWRNGETIAFRHKAVNRLYATDRLDPKVLDVFVDAENNHIRQNATIQLNTAMVPSNADNQINWTSSNKNILKVDERGRVTAVGDINQSAIITATAAVNKLTSSVELTIIPWTPKPVTAVTIASQDAAVRQTMVEGEIQKLRAILFPINADNVIVNWNSSNQEIARIDDNGKVTALKPGTTTISAKLGDSAVNNANKVVDKFTLTVKPLIKPFIKITNAEAFSGKPIPVNSQIEVKVHYNAGTGNQVISSDEGGIRFWLRHFQSKWIPVEDRIVVDSSVLKTNEGISSKVISLAGLKPTSELPEGQFYQLRVSFASSDGTMNDALIYPLNLVAID
ncbi:MULTISPECIES: FG-GAP-like repeat-containing protein [unclassified Psychrosphaera]|uniref:FG-GAP-like repeat-containing protein n=1 Tax=unclassified Psychrosphaera TaxID=2641570 RepID=UPI002090D079|nr:MULTISPECIES: FG-GAP-like repeat-containing protein [unclassified Psychrosphaera]